jgi:hypothetical protein
MNRRDHFEPAKVPASGEILEVVICIVTALATAGVLIFILFHG